MVICILDQVEPFIPIPISFGLYSTREADQIIDTGAWIESGHIDVGKCPMILVAIDI